MASLYYLSAFTVFFLILDYKTGILLPVYYLIGYIVRLSVGTFGSDSIFSSDIIRNRFIIVLAIACTLGIIGSVLIKILIDYLSAQAYKDPVTGLPNMKRFQEIFLGAVKNEQNIRNLVLFS